MTRVALVTAAGTGTRMGAPIPKQYLDLGGLPVLTRTLLAFEKHPLIDFVVVTVPFGDEESCWARFIRPFGLVKVKAVIAGGSSRQESVFKGLQLLRDTDLAVIHDGARPLVGRQIITETVLAAESVGAAIAAVPVKQTVKRKKAGMLETVPREGLWLAHTPQTFLTPLIVQAHEKAGEDGFESTDDAALIERLGLPVEVVADLDTNIKITTPADLEWARFILSGAVP